MANVLVSGMAGTARGAHYERHTQHYVHRILQLAMARCMTDAAAPASAATAQRCFLDIAFVAPSAMARANEVHKGSAGPTDVLSFPAAAERPLMPPALTTANFEAMVNCTTATPQSYTQTLDSPLPPLTTTSLCQGGPQIMSSRSVPEAEQQREPLSLDQLISDLNDAEDASETGLRAGARRSVDLGSMLICPAYIRAKISRWPTHNMREPDYAVVALVHATLHLCGYRHDDDDSHRAMITEERRIVRSLLRDVTRGRMPPFELPCEDISLPE